VILITVGVFLADGQDLAPMTSTASLDGFKVNQYLSLSTLTKRNGIE
jgi:hypothetical protein